MTTEILPVFSPKQPGLIITEAWSSNIGKTISTESLAAQPIASTISYTKGELLAKLKLAEFSSETRSVF